MSFPLSISSTYNMPGIKLIFSNFLLNWVELNRCRFFWERSHSNKDRIMSKWINIWECKMESIQISWIYLNFSTFHLKTRWMPCSFSFLIFFLWNEAKAPSLITSALLWVANDKRLWNVKVITLYFSFLFCGDLGFGLKVASAGGQQRVWRERYWVHPSPPGMEVIQVTQLQEILD